MIYLHIFTTYFSSFHFSIFFVYFEFAESGMMVSTCQFQVDFLKRGKSAQAFWRETPAGASYCEPWRGTAYTANCEQWWRSGQWVAWRLGRRRTWLGQSWYQRSPSRRKQACASSSDVWVAFEWASASRRTCWPLHSKSCPKGAERRLRAQKGRLRGVFTLVAVYSCRSYSVCRGSWASFISWFFHILSWFYILLSLCLKALCCRGVGALSN